jgi:hypothetical protein
MLALSACTAPESSLGEMTLARLAPLVKPLWRVGDQWQYSDGYALQVSETAGPVAKFERLDAPDQWFIADGFFRNKSHSGSATREVVFRSETLDQLNQFYGAPIGQPIVFIREYLKDKELVRHQDSWVVEGKERISVPAGTFDTFVIVMRTRSLTSDWTGYERWWYAPAVRNYVRMEYKYGQFPDGSRVLQSFRLAS